MQKSERAFGRSGAAHQPTVLVVEDVVLVRMLVAETLRQRGFHVVEAASGEEAIRALQRRLLPIDAILSDVFMPGAQIDGIGLAAWVLRQRPDVKLLLGSGFVLSDVDLGDMAKDVGPILPKPYNYDELERRLREDLG